MNEESPPKEEDHPQENKTLDLADSTVSQDSSQELEQNPPPTPTSKQSKESKISPKVADTGFDDKLKAAMLQGAKEMLAKPVSPVEEVKEQRDSKDSKDSAGEVKVTAPKLRGCLKGSRAA